MNCMMVLILLSDGFRFRSELKVTAHLQFAHPRITSRYAKNTDNHFLFSFQLSAFRFPFIRFHLPIKIFIQIVS